VLISKDFVQDFVDLKDISSKDFANQLTLSTAEVEGFESVGDFLNNVKVVQIDSIKKHPDAEKLNLVTFTYIEDKSSKKLQKEVVCGANNVKEGLKVPYASLGTILPGGFKLEAKKIRGIVSEGMLCSSEEIGLDEECSGLYELPGNAEIGMSMLDFLKVKQDTIVDIDNKSLTHRPDLWGHYGFARELSLIFNKDLKQPYDNKWEEELLTKINSSVESAPVELDVAKDSSCLGFIGLSLSNVKVEQSPKWMQDRLNNVGLRPINSIVDISNYVMVELGHPLHIYDRDKISGAKLTVKKLKDLSFSDDIKSSFKTLDDIDRVLIDSDTMICDDQSPLVLAGVMGGLSSGVSDDTTNLFIEVANWIAPEVRSASTRLGLRTESSQRYEKSLDTNQLQLVLLRTLDLILQFNPDAKIIGKIVKDTLNTVSFENKVVKTSYSKLSRVLGKEIENKEIDRIFSGLGFVQKNISNDSFEVEVPSFRDKSEYFEADLVEEVGRIVGYDNIIPDSPKVELSPIRLSNAKKLHRKIQDFMIFNCSALECITYPLVGQSLLKKCDWPNLNPETKIINALSKDVDRLRPSLIPSILESVKNNAKNLNSFKLFEIGRIYNAQEKDKLLNFSESNCLIMGFYNKSENVFLDALNDFKRLSSSLAWPVQISPPNKKFECSVLPSNFSGVHPHEVLHVRAMGKVDGAIFTVHPKILKNFKFSGNLTLCVLDLSGLDQKEFHRFKKYTPISKFPTATFDCTVVVKNDSTSEQVLKSVTSCKIKELDEVKIKDIYKLPDGRTTFTLGCLFKDSSQTIPADKLKNYENKIVASLNKSGFPLKEA
jgi:phenylalanyl-tRNA synthetase beta chain